MMSSLPISSLALNQKQRCFPRTPISSPIDLHSYRAVGTQNRDYKGWCTKFFPMLIQHKESNIETIGLGKKQKHSSNT